MELRRRKIGELVAAVGVVLGLIALWTSYVDTKTMGGVTAKYADDGTVMAVVIIVLGLAACCLVASLLGAADLDLVAATAGAAGFGFFLFVPSSYAFKSLDWVGTGGWLGICAGLIPLGAGVARFAARRRSDAKTPGVNPAIAVAAIGLVLIVIGIWAARTGRPGYSLPGRGTHWDTSVSGHALGLLMLVLAIASALLIASAVSSRSGLLADLALIVSGITAGLAMAEGIAAFDAMSNGAWMELIGGFTLLLGLIGARVLKFPAMRKASASSD